MPVPVERVANAIIYIYICEIDIPTNNIITMKTNHHTINKGGLASLMAGAIAAMMWSCSSDDKVPMATGNELTGVLSVQQVALTVNGHDYPSEVEIESAAGADGSVMSETHSLTLTVGDLQIPDVSVETIKGRTVFQPRLTKAEFATNGTMGRNGMTVEGELNYGKTHISLSGVVDNPTVSANRKLQAEVKYDMSAFAAAGRRYELSLDGDGITRRAMQRTAEKPVLKLGDESITADEAVKWLTDVSLASLRDKIGYDKVRFAPGSDGKMAVEMRSASNGQYVQLDQNFAYLPERNGRYIYMYAPEEFNHLIASTRDIAEDVSGNIWTEWLAVTSPTWRSEAHLYELCSISDGQFVLDYIDSKNSLGLWSAAMDASYPNNPGLETPEHSKAWRIVKWLNALVEEQKIEIETRIVAKEVK